MLFKLRLVSDEGLVLRLGFLDRYLLISFSAELCMTMARVEEEGVRDGHIASPMVVDLALERRKFAQFFLRITEGGKVRARRYRLAVVDSHLVELAAVFEPLFGLLIVAVLLRRLVFSVLIGIAIVRRSLIVDKALTLEKVLLAPFLSAAALRLVLIRRTP